MVSASSPPTPHVTLSFGYDTERPYGPWARGPEGPSLRRDQLEMVERLNAVFDELQVPRTFFLLGDYLEQCTLERSAEAMRRIYDRGNPLVDLQQHSYSHPSLRPIPGRPDEALATSAEFGADVRRATERIAEVLGARVTGMRIPRGYDEDLTSLPEVVAELSRSGIEFVSSDLRSPSRDGAENLEGALVPERLPHDYGAIGFPELLEIPSHGFQDVIFTDAMAHRVTGRGPLGGSAITRHYLGLLETAHDLASKRESMVHVALCLHPFALREYDPELAIHRALVTGARETGAEILSYRALADRLR